MYHLFFLFSTETTYKPTTTVTGIEQQRERERQRLREEEERRKKLLVRKDYQPSLQVQNIPKFEPLAVENNNDESRTNKTKTPTTGTGTFSPNFPIANGATTKLLNKPLSITPLPNRPNLPANHDENDPSTTEPTTAALATGAAPKKFIIKKRSTTLVGTFRIHFKLN